MTVQYEPMKLIDQIRQNNYSYTHSYTKKVTEADANVEKLQDKAEAFKKSVKKLKRYSSGGISRDLLESQIEDLVKSYNDMKNSSAKVTDKDVQKQISKLEKLFSDNEKELKKIGVEKVNGKYSFDSKTFADAADKAIDALFVGHDSFIGQADKIMRKVDETASDAQYNINEYKLSRTLNYEEADMTLAANMTLAGQTTSVMTIVQSSNLSDSTIQDSTKKLLAYFAQSVYHADGTNANKNIDKLNQLCIDHKDKLAKLGLTFDNEQKNMVFNASVNMTDPDFRNTYNELFGKNAVFGNAVSEYCKNIFNDIVQPDKIGVSIIDAQA
ncbi:MAG: hypothetical protein K2N44_18975 [Lachnospiraceae bacterium]|nr:hypothetical protein [Lachnospiraceae bacterium]